MASWLTLILLATGTLSSPPLKNADLEAGEIGQRPEHWFSPVPGFTAALTTDNPHGGLRCAHIAPTGEADAPFGNLMQTVPANDLRNQRIRVRAFVRTRTTGPDDRAQFWVREDRAGGRIGLFDNMNDRPVRSDDWKQIVIEGALHDDAQSLSVGLMVLGSAEAWLDDVSIEVLGDAAPASREPPRPLTERGLKNLTAFTRLLGYVRFFHPSDQAAALDWERFAVRGVRTIESARTDAELAGRLRTLFAPYAMLNIRALDAAGADAAPSATDYSASTPDTWDESHRIMVWDHVGVGLGPRSIYRSRRTARPGHAVGAHSDTPEPHAATLVPGVTASIPLYCHADDDGTYPREMPPAPEAEPGELSAADRAVRLADVALAWTIFQHFYPYFDVIETDWDAALATALRSAAEDADECAFADTLRELVAGLRDGHGFVVHPCLSGRAQPPLSVAWVQDRLVVTAVHDGAPPIEVGSVIAQIDGVATADVAARADKRLSAATPQFLRHRSAAEILAGPPGSQLSLTLEVDGETRAVQLVRSGPLQHPPRRQRVTEELEPGIWYLDLDRLDVADLKAVIDRLAEARGVILDLRGYPRKQGAWQILGHLSDRRDMTCAQWLIPVASRPDRRDMQFNRSNWPVVPRSPTLGGRLVFLTDGQAISAAETMLGIVEHYELAAIVGQATAGTNGNINPFELPGGYRVIWTGMKVLKHDGSQHHGVGIQPTIPVERTIAGIRAGRDEYLERALAYIRATPEE